MNRAARVCSIAPCGQVWATAQAWNWATGYEAEAVSATQLQAEDMGHFTLKVRVFCCVYLYWQKSPTKHVLASCRIQCQNITKGCKASPSATTLRCLQAALAHRIHLLCIVEMAGTCFFSCWLLLLLLLHHA